MRVRIWPAVGICFVAVLSLMPLFGWLVSRRAAEIDLQARAAHQQYQKADEIITGIREYIYKASLLLQNPSLEREAAKKDLDVIREATAADFHLLASLIDSTQHAQLLKLESGLNEYWRLSSLSLSGIEGAQGRPTFEVDRAAGVLKLAEETDALNEADLLFEERQVDAQQASLRRFARSATGVLLVLGFAIAVVSIAYLARLERISEKETGRASKAEYELRRLSNQLVRVQEDERKTISRELHDEVGQILTGLRLELAGLSHSVSDGSFDERLDSVKRLSEDALRSVRNLAMLLRPSMLDDLGLEPALRWHAREFSRRSGIAVSIAIEGNIDALPDAVRICLYRTIQESLTNCAKHAEAKAITVTVKREADLVTASVKDNGKGFDPHSLRTQGLGLMGMEERVRALQGQLTVSSERGNGTLVDITLPLAAEPAPSAYRSL